MGRVDYQELARGQSPILSEWQEAARKLVPAYLFYEPWRSWDGIDLPIEPHDELLGRRGTCSSCGAVYLWDRKDAHMKLRHGDSFTCPICGAKCEAVASGKMPERKRLRGDFRIVFCRGDEKTVRLYCYYIWWHFGRGENEPTLEWYEDARYELEPGAFRIWKHEYIGRETGGAGDYGWHEHKRPIEPWVSGMYGEARGYYIVLDGLGGTFLGHLPVEDIAGWNFYSTSAGYTRQMVRIPWCKLLCTAAMYPKIEILAKRGIEEPVIELVTDRRKNARYLNWNAKRPLDFLRIPKADAVEALDGGFCLEAVKICRDIGIRYADAERVAGRSYTASEIITWSLECGDGPKEVVRYILTHNLASNGLHLLRDYREAAGLLGRDLSVPSIRWPKNLIRAHDEATRSAQAIREERRLAARAEAYAPIYREYRNRFEYEAGDYMAMVPEQLADIALEGANQRHCVGGYIDRHAAGKLAIMFIRRVAAPMIPLWTAELTPDGKLTQIQGYHNDPDLKPKGEDKAWVDGWLREIQKRLRKEKRHG